MSIGPPANLDGQNLQPLLLVQFVFQNAGPTLSVSSQNLDSAIGGFTYSPSYLPRVTKESFDAIQAMSQTGIDALPNVTVEMADADMAMFAYERTYGFMGATVTIKFVQASTTTAGIDGTSAAGDFTDELIIFTGVCEAANRTGNETLSVRAINRFNLSRIELPLIPIQRNCPKAFPPDADSRVAALNNPDSIYHFCRYSADQAGGLGNLNAGVAFTECGKTASDCKLRGMFGIDTGGTLNGSFAGVTFDPPQAWQGKQYISGKIVQGFNNANYDKYNDFAPMMFGHGWVTAVVANVVGEANSTRCEAIIGTGPRGDMDSAVSGVESSLWNDQEYVLRLGSGPNQSPDLVFSYLPIANGDIHGTPNLTGIYDGRGDPYGSMQVIEPTVPIQVSDSASVPNIKALVLPQPFPSEGSMGTWNVAFNPDNHAFNVYWIMRLAGFLASDFDQPSVWTAMQICNEQINYTKGDGTPGTNQRYRLSFPIEKQRSLADIIQAVRASGKLLVTPNVNGLISFRVKSTLFETNYSAATKNSLVPSMDRFGVTSADAYTAYDFDESDVLDGTLQFSQLPLNECVNEIVVKFTDEENKFTQSTLTYRDPNAYQRATQKVSGSFTIEGCLNADQVQRCATTKFAELYYGNPRHDASGTWSFRFDTSFRMATLGLRVGDIVSFSDQQYGLTKQLFRIQAIQPHSDFETCSVELHWHEDIWYTDTFGVTNSDFVPQGKAIQVAIGLITATATVGWSGSATQVAIGKISGVANAGFSTRANHFARGQATLSVTFVPQTVFRFVDDETPSGTQNGSNQVFTLSETPTPATSLLLTIQGVVQIPGQDFNLVGATITYTGTIAPASGDYVRAWYRTVVANSGPVLFADDETPSGTQNSSNQDFTLAHTPSPAASLFHTLQGVLQIPGVDITLSGNTITYITSKPAPGDLQRAWYRY